MPGPPRSSRRNPLVPPREKCSLPPKTGNVGRRRRAFTPRAAPGRTSGASSGRTQPASTAVDWSTRLQEIVPCAGLKVDNRSSPTVLQPPGPGEDSMPGWPSVEPRVASRQYGSVPGCALELLQPAKCAGAVPAQTGRHAPMTIRSGLCAPRRRLPGCCRRTMRTDRCNARRSVSLFPEWQPRPITA